MYPCEPIWGRRNVYWRCDLSWILTLNRCTQVWSFTALCAGQAVFFVLISSFSSHIIFCSLFVCFSGSGAQPHIAVFIVFPILKGIEVCAITNFHQFQKPLVYLGIRLILQLRSSAFAYGLRLDSGIYKWRRYWSSSKSPLAPTSAIHSWHFGAKRGKTLRLRRALLFRLWHMFYYTLKVCRQLAWIRCQVNAYRIR